MSVYHIASMCKSNSNKSRDGITLEPCPNKQTASHKSQISNTTMLTFSLLVVVLTVLSSSHCFTPSVFKSSCRGYDMFRTMTTGDNTGNNADDTWSKFTDNHLRRARIESAVEDMLKSNEFPGKNEYLAGTVLVRSENTLAVRLATPLDDHLIASLRVGVFSNFTPDSQKIFCERSCHLIATRRQRGANCIVATTTDTDRLMSIIGSAEVSYHEFIDTKLFRCRPKDKILYVTEVAVDEKHRRKGVAKLMMEAIDSLASTRKIETIYLHVDVTNVDAVNLYKRSGYNIQPSSGNSIFYEFTKRLNLHNGATNGRRHHLMAKDLRQTTWLEYSEHNEACISERMFGIEIPVA